MAFAGPSCEVRSIAGGFDLGIVQLDPNGRLRFSSYLGGSGDDDNAGAPPALDQWGNVYASGVTSATDFPVTPGAIQPTYATQHLLRRRPSHRSRRPCSDESGGRLPALPRRDRRSCALLASDLERVSQCIGGRRDRRVAGDDVGEAVASARLVELSHSRVEARP